MDISNPIQTLIPGGRGAVLSVLARSGEPLSGRRIAELAGPAVGSSRTATILPDLVRAGIVTAVERPPAVLYSLNREHVAADAISVMCDLRGALIDRIRAELSRWTTPPVTAWLFGSAARGDGDLDSDIDVLLVRPEMVDEDDPVWESQRTRLAEAIGRWSGNGTALIEFTDGELWEWRDSDERLLAEIESDGLHLAGRRRLLGTREASLR